MNLDRLRPGQAECIRVARQRFRLGLTQTAFILPMRYGKSHTIRLIALDLVERGDIAVALDLAVNEYLADQVLDPAAWAEAIHLADVGLKSPKIRRIESPIINPTANGEMFLSATVQLVHRNLDMVCDWIRLTCAQTGKPVLVTFDECQMTSLKNEWGRVCRQLMQAGAHIHYFTGFAVRTDGVRIPGFEYTVTRAEDIKAFVPRVHEDPRKLYVDVYEGVKELLTLSAHVAVTFTEAWDKKYLCKIGLLPFDIRDPEGRRLSEMESGDARSCLAVSLRDPVVLKQGLGDMVTQLATLRARVPDIAALVFTGHDESSDKEFNAHARQIKHFLTAMAPQLRVVIATSADGGGRGNIERFKHGDGDVLLVKDMASLGIDIPRIKVGLDFSRVRTAASWFQRLMRVATPYHGILHAAWITPDDVLTRALWAHLVTADHGEITSKQLELIETLERDRCEDRDAALPFVPDGTDYADFEDTLRTRADASKRGDVQELLRRLPLLTTLYSHAELANGLDGVVFTHSAHAVENTQQTIEQLRAEINAAVDALSGARIQAAGYSSQEYGEIRRDLFVRAYKALAIRERHLDEIDSVEMLRRLRDLLHIWRKEQAREKDVPVK